MNNENQSGITDKNKVIEKHTRKEETKILFTNNWTEPIEFPPPPK